MERTEWIDFVEARLSARGDEGSHRKPFFKVLPNMRNANECPYDPIFFTFGPYHAKLSVPLSPCDLFKIQAAKALTSAESFSSLVGKISSRDADIRKLYAEPWDHSEELRLPKILAHLLALDALTIIAAACHIHVLQPHTLALVIQRDAFLLDHQLPLFVLQAAIDSVDNVSETSVDNVSETSLRKVVEFYGFESCYPFRGNVSACTWRDPTTLDESMIGHIHHMLGESSGESSREGVVDQFRTLPTASKLRRCGISFAAGPGGFSGIKFDGCTRVLTLPEITVFSGTQSYLLNLLAYEATVSCYSEEPGPVISFVLLMDFLIDVEEDVKVLVDAQVIHNQLGSHGELASMWNKMAVNLPICLTREDAHVIDKVNKACQAIWSRWRAAFLDTYWDKKPWLFFSIVAALFFFVLTALQTIYTMLQYHPPH